MDHFAIRRASRVLQIAKQLQPRRVTSRVAIRRNKSKGRSSRIRNGDDINSSSSSSDADVGREVIVLDDDADAIFTSPTMLSTLKKMIG